MNKDNSKKKEKEKKSNKLKILIWTLLIFLTLGLVAFIILSILITDKNTNTFESSKVSNEQIINKEFVSGLSKMNENFEFKLTLDDVNEMLYNSTNKESVSEYVTKAYLETTSDNNFTWCFDLNIPVFTTRLKINTHIEFIENTSVFLIDSMTIGKINAWSMLQSGGYITNDALTTLFNNASLPIEPHLEYGYFAYYPNKFVSMFDLGEFTSELFATINTPERLSVETNVIGFKLSLDGVRVNSPSEISGSYNLKEELKPLVTSSSYSSLSSGENAILKVSEEDFSKWIKNSYTKDLEVEKIESDISSSKVTVNLKKVEVKFTNNELVVIWTIKLGNAYFEVKESLGVGSGGDDYSMYFNLSFLRSINEGNLQKILMDDFISKLVSSGYATYQESNSLLTFNFDDLIEDIIVQIAPKRLNIEDNKFSFFIKK